MTRGTRAAYDDPRPHTRHIEPRGRSAAAHGSTAVIGTLSPRSTAKRAETICQRLASPGGECPPGSLWHHAEQGAALTCGADTMRAVSDPDVLTYRLTEEQTLLRDAVRVLADERVAPRASEIDRSGEFPQDLRQLLAEQDILGLPFPEEYGGLGGELLTL